MGKCSVSCIRAQSRKPDIIGIEVKNSDTFYIIQSYENWPFKTKTLKLKTYDININEK